MKSIILVLAFCVCASFAYELEEYTWEGFKKIHNRTYVGVEEMMREKIFDDNLQYITDFNAEGHSFKLGVNQFADMVSILKYNLVNTNTNGRSQFVRLIRSSYLPKQGWILLSATNYKYYATKN